MVRPTVLNEAKALHADLITRNPGGCRLPRHVFDKLVVMGYGKSKEAADRITATGELAGLWIRGHDPHAPGFQAKKGWVQVLPLEGPGGQGLPSTA